MSRATPVRKSHTSTSDLLTWSEAPSPSTSNTARANQVPPINHLFFPRHNASLSLYHFQPPDRVGKVLFGGHITDEEAHNLNKR